MDLSLDELIKSKRSTSRGGRRGGGRQGGSRGGGVKRGGGGGGGSNFRSNGAAGGGGGPIRRGRPMARRSNGFSPYSKVRNTRKSGSFLNGGDYFGPPHVSKSYLFPR